MKNEAWMEVAKEVKMRVEDVKKWWHNIQSQAVHCQARKYKSYEKMPYRTKWLRWHMSWIKPYVHRRKKPVEQMASSLSHMEFQEEPQSQESFSQMEFQEEPESQQFDNCKMLTK